MTRSSHKSRHRLVKNVMPGDILVYHSSYSLEFIIAVSKPTANTALWPYRSIVNITTIRHDGIMTYGINDDTIVFTMKPEQKR